MSFRLDLTPDPATLAAAATLRHRVFVLEQGVDSAIERDGQDTVAKHVAVHDPEGEVVATGRLMLLGHVAKVQRVAVSSELRGAGVGRLVMAGLETLAAADGAREIRLSSQREAVGFYERLGYQGQGAPYLEAGIVHLAMSKPVAALS